jgi:hypothetical protein
MPWLEELAVTCVGVEACACQVQPPVGLLCVDLCRCLCGGTVFAPHALLVCAVFGGGCCLSLHQRYGRQEVSPFVAASAATCRGRPMVIVCVSVLTACAVSSACTCRPSAPAGAVTRWPARLMCQVFGGWPQVVAVSVDTVCCDVSCRPALSELLCGRRARSASFSWC